jgi:hypothetical protein
MSDAMTSNGTTFGVGAGTSPETYTNLGEVRSINGPSGSASVLDATNLSSTAKEKLMGLPDEGQITIEGNFDYDDSMQAAMIAARAAQTSKNFKITYTDATYVTFAGYVTGWSTSVSIDSVVSYTATIEIDGALTWA